MVGKSIPRFTKSPSLVLIGLVLTEIQAFKNVKYLQRNVWKTGQIRMAGFPYISLLQFVIVKDKMTSIFDASVRLSTMIFVMASLLPRGSTGASFLFLQVFVT